ncbi:hypothetical protein [Solimonas marina]|uniref:Uncharacterized protein n=1 Tax=Solimonas marina TaxID=2714601 RepID=A0A969WF53_9GAMM|nr:hypothetical protein [Solimonas marina]NKF23610.1 hypothetical protein [Solimonas marina]
MIPEIHLLQRDTQLLATQYETRNHPNQAWTGDERRRWAPETVTVLRRVKYELGVSTADLALKRAIDAVCGMFERRGAVSPTAEQRRAWAEDAMRLLRQLETELGERPSVVAASDISSAWQAQMRDGRRPVSLKSTRQTPSSLRSHRRRGHDRGARNAHSIETAAASPRTRAPTRRKRAAQDTTQPVQAAFTAW